MRPSEIRFSQDSIANRFGEYSDHSDRPIGETLDDLLLKKCSPYDIPRIRVSERNGKYYSADNRRLWVFKKAEELGAINDIPVKNGYIKPEKLTTTNDGVSVNVRGNPGGIFWRSRKKKQHTVKRQGNNVAQNAHKNKTVTRTQGTVPVHQSYNNEGTYRDEAFTNVMRTQRNDPVVHRYTEEVHRPRTSGIHESFKPISYTNNRNNPYQVSPTPSRTDPFVQPKHENYNSNRNYYRDEACNNVMRTQRNDPVVHRYTEEVNRHRTSGIHESFKPTSSTNNRNNPYQVSPTPSRTDPFVQPKHENYNSNRNYKYSNWRSDQSDIEKGCCCCIL